MESDTCASAPVFHALEDMCALFRFKWNPPKPLVQRQMRSGGQIESSEKTAYKWFYTRAVRCPFIYTNVKALQDSAKGSIICHEHYLNWLHSLSHCAFLSKWAGHSVVLVTNLPELCKVLCCQSFFQLAVACKFKLVQPTQSFSWDWTEFVET